MAEDRSSRALTIGAALSLLWLLMLAALWLTADSSGGAGWVSVIAALMPLALIWLAVGVARAVDAMRTEAELLRAMLDQMRRDGGAGGDTERFGGTRPSGGNGGQGRPAGTRDPNTRAGDTQDQDPCRGAAAHPEDSGKRTSHRAARPDLFAQTQASAHPPVHVRNRSDRREDYPDRSAGCEQSNHRADRRADGADADLSAAGSQNRSPQTDRDSHPDRSAYGREQSNRQARAQASAAGSAHGHERRADGGHSARSARQAPPTKTSPPEAADSPQQSLRFDTPEPVNLAPETLILALNFPDGPDDRHGIAALREALQNPDHARLLRSAQDVVSLLAARDLFMDELAPGPVDRDAWLRFAEGQRGQAVAGVGAIRDPEALSNAAAVMRGDEVFRDAAHHFLRLFDRSLTRLLPQLDDEAIGWLSETRSARAFMLLGRVAGLFGQEG